MCGYSCGKLDGSRTNKRELTLSGNIGDMNYLKRSTTKIASTKPNKCADLKVMRRISNGDGETALPLPAVGDFRDGGVVFWVNPSDLNHGLVCAIEDVSSAIQWYNGGYIPTGATGLVMGAGQSSTNAIIAAQGGIEEAYAAGVARTYKGDRCYNDWFLPSKEEFEEMAANVATINYVSLANGGSSKDCKSGVYWTSTEFNSTLAHFFGFLNGNARYSSKKLTYSIRTIRAF